MSPSTSLRTGLRTKPTGPALRREKEVEEEALNTPVTVPPHHDVMGAIGGALLTHEYVETNGDKPTRFKGWKVSEVEYDTSSFECKGCSNLCEVVQIKVDRQVLARWGGRCGKWEM